VNHILHHVQINICYTSCHLLLFSVLLCVRQRARLGYHLGVDVRGEPYQPSEPLNERSSNQPRRLFSLETLCPECRVSLQGRMPRRRLRRGGGGGGGGEEEEEEVKLKVMMMMVMLGRHTKELSDFLPSHTDICTCTPRHTRHIIRRLTHTPPNTPPNSSDQKASSQQIAMTACAHALCLNTTMSQTPLRHNVCTSNREELIIPT
jgi:hypothetical protein